MIAGKSEGSAKCFGFVQDVDAKPRRRLFEVLRSQGGAGQTIGRIIHGWRRDSAVNQVLDKRLVKRQQMQQTKKGAHLLVQACTKVLNEEWEDCFWQQYHGFRPLPAETLPMAA